MRDSTVFYAEWLPLIESLPEEKQLELYRLIWKFDRTHVQSVEQVEINDPQMKGIYQFIINKVEQNQEKYDKEIEKRRRAGIASGEARRAKRTHVQSVEHKRTPNKSVEQTRTNRTDNVNVNVDDKEGVIKNPPKTENLKPHPSNTESKRSSSDSSLNETLIEPEKKPPKPRQKLTLSDAKKPKPPETGVGEGFLKIDEGGGVAPDIPSQATRATEVAQLVSKIRNHYHGDRMYRTRCENLGPKDRWKPESFLDEYGNWLVRKTDKLPKSPFNHFISFLTKKASDKGYINENKKPPTPQEVEKKAVERQNRELERLNRLKTGVKTWEGMKKKVAAEIGEETFEKWFKNVELYDLNKGNLTLNASKFEGDWIKREYGEVLAKFTTGKIFFRERKEDSAGKTRKKQ